MVAHTTTRRGPMTPADVTQFTRLAWKFALKFAKASGGLVEAEDLAQELLLHLAAKAHKYDPDKAARSTWVWPVMFNHAVRYLEVAKRQGFAGGDLGRPTRVDPAADGTMKVERIADREHPGEMPEWPWELWRRVACAGRLDDREGRIVYWRMHGLKLVEIAFREDVGKERVRQLYERAMGKLREHSAAVAAVTDDLPRRGVVR